jgi:hypothetical protein
LAKEEMMSGFWEFGFLALAGFWFANLMAIWILAAWPPPPYPGDDQEKAIREDRGRVQTHEVKRVVPKIRRGTPVS